MEESRGQLKEFIAQTQQKTLSSRPSTKISRSSREREREKEVRIRAHVRIERNDIQYQRKVSVAATTFFHRSRIYKFLWGLDKQLFSVLRV